MPFYRDLHAKVKFPADYSRALEQFVGLFTNLVIKKVSATVIGVAAGANNEQVSLGIEGLWRWINAEVQATHPGGAAGSYDIVATTTANVFTTGTEEEEDHTNYNWALQIVPTGTIPSGGGIAATRKLGTLKWSGTEITSITQEVPGTPSHAAQHATAGRDPITPASIGAAAESLANAIVAAFAGDPFPTGLSSGVTGPSSDFASFVAAINAGTGELSSTGALGSAKVYVNGLRAIWPSTTLAGLKPTALPASGKYISVGFFLEPPTVFGGAPTMVVKSGVEKATEAEAIAAPSSAPGNSLRIREVVILNTAGVYSIVKQTDRRAAIKGFYWRQRSLIAGSSPISTVAGVPLATIRAENTNVLVRAQFTVEAETAGEVLTVSVNGEEPRQYTIPLAAKPFVVSYEAIILQSATGTTLYEVKAKLAAEGAGHKVTIVGTGEGGTPAGLLTIEAAKGGNNNGTT